MLWVRLPEPSCRYAGGVVVWGGAHRTIPQALAGAAQNPAQWRIHLPKMVHPQHAQILRPAPRHQRRRRAEVCVCSCTCFCLIASVAFFHLFRGTSTTDPFYNLALYLNITVLSFVELIWNISYKLWCVGHTSKLSLLSSGKLWPFSYYRQFCLTSFYSDAFLCSSDLHSVIMGLYFS